MLLLVALINLTLTFLQVRAAKKKQLFEKLCANSQFLPKKFQFKS